MYLLPGISEIILLVMAQQMKVHTVMAGMAVAVGRTGLRMLTHRPSQKMCIR